MNNIKYLYAPNRTEEFGTDLWNSFILPPYFKELEYGFQQKPIRFVGGRGSGKTALLRYLSFRTQFSPKRHYLPAHTFNNIGFYFKAEMSYVTLFTGEDLTERTWVNCFKYALCLIIAEDLLEFFIRILDEPERYASHGTVPDVLKIDSISDFGDDFSEDIRKLYPTIRKKRVQLSTWLKNIEDPSLKPTFIEMELFLDRIVKSVKKQISFLNESTFHILIDEYENLLVYQQKVVNTLMKGAEPPFAFHVAMKKNGMTTTQTLGAESIQEKNDYRTVNIESQIESNFEIFCAELFFFRLATSPNFKLSVPINVDDLKNIEKLDSRFANPEYKKNLLEGMRKILPGLSTEEASRICLKENYNRWKEIVLSGINNKEKSFSVDDFYYPDEFPEATVVSCALIHQVSKNPSLLSIEFEKLRAGQSSKYKEWIHKYLNGTIFLLWFNARKANVNYAGFDVFLSLSKLNIRHFIELCHIALKKTSTISSIENLVITRDAQALAAKEAANYFFEETKSSGFKGNHLFSLIATIGNIFQYSQQRLSQSEFERTHFSIENGTASLSEQACELLHEAVKWSVLYAEEETKVKSERLLSFEYTLNPIYAPFFNISYRKGRKLELTSRQAEVLLTGSEVDKQNLFKDFRNQWLGEDQTGQYTLLGGIEND